MVTSEHVGLLTKQAGDVCSGSTAVEGLALRLGRREDAGHHANAARSNLSRSNVDVRLLGEHDAFYVRFAHFEVPLVAGKNSGKGHGEPGIASLSGNGGGQSPGKIEANDVGRARPAKAFCETRPCRSSTGVRGRLTAIHNLCSKVANGRCEGTLDGVGVGPTFVVNADNMVSPNRLRVFQDLVRTCTSEGDRSDLATSGFLVPEGRLKRELIVGAHDHLGTAEVDGAAADADRSVCVRNLLDEDDDVGHAFTLLAGPPGRSPRRLSGDKEGPSKRALEARVQGPSLGHAHLMSYERRPIGPEEDLQDLMDAFGELFEGTYMDELRSLGHCEEQVFSFEVAYADLMEHDVIRNHLVDDIERFMLTGEQVLNDRFRQHMHAPCRLVLRLSGLPEERRRPLDSLRMRDRGRLFTFDVAVTGATPPIGYLQRATYVCRIPGCGETVVVNQRLAREREKPSSCQACMQRMFEGLPDNDEGEYIRRMAHQSGRFGDFGLVTEDLRYIDVQYLSVVDVVPATKGPWGQGRHTWTAVVDEDHVGSYPVGSLLRLHATVNVDHLPERNFVKDTRRCLLLRVEGIEPLDDAAHVDDVQWVSGPPV